MALMPEDVLKKRFTASQFRRGYHEREVEEFLGEIVVGLHRLSSANDDLRLRLNACQGDKGVIPPQAQERDRGQLICRAGGQGRRRGNCPGGRGRIPRSTFAPAPAPAPVAAVRPEQMITATPEQSTGMVPEAQRRGPRCLGSLGPSVARGRRRSPSREPWSVTTASVLCSAAQGQLIELEQAGADQGADSEGDVRRQAGQL
jgi:DivIVA domain-containing protein